MNDYTKVLLEADSKGRINISAVDDHGMGTGYRLAGPKFIGDHLNPAGAAKVLATVELTERDVKEIRYYLEIWDRIQAAKSGSASDDA